MNNFELCDVAAELEGVSCQISMLAELVAPKAINGISAPTENATYNAFFAITTHLDRIADYLNELEGKQLQQKKAAAPTVESKGNR